MIEIKYTSLHLFNSLLCFLKHLLCAAVQKEKKKTDIKSKYILLWNRCMQSAKLKLFFDLHALKYISTLIPLFLEVILGNKHGDFGDVPP